MALLDSEPSSSTALISDVDSPYGAEDNPLKDAVTSQSSEQVFDDVPQERKQLGVLSAISLIFNRMIGTGIYATSSLILRSSGSVGMSLVMWLIGGLIAASGMAVYVEFGTGIPRSGAEKNYLEYVYRKPKLLATCCIAAYFCLMGWSAANAVVFGEYMVHAFGGHITQWNTRLTGFACLTFVSFLHAFKLSWGLRLQNILALVKLVTLLFVVMSGILAIFGWIPLNEQPRNFDDLWGGTNLNPNAFVTGLYNVIWAFIGYSNAHYALSEAKDPLKIVKRAAPLALSLITVVYFLVNVAYLAVVSKDDILDGGRVVAALFFRNLFGVAAERILSIVISISTLGNLLAVSFTQSRVIQEFGREGVIPRSAVLASNAPYNTPFGALVLQWIMCSYWALSPPPGDAYNFVLNLHSYPYSTINIFVAGGLLWLYLSPTGKRDWNPPFRAGIPVVTCFFLSNLFLGIAPLLPPMPGFSLYEDLPYWSHVAASFGMLGLGIGYWYILTKLLPNWGGYKLVRETVIQEDGISRVVLRKVAT